MNSGIPTLYKGTMFRSRTEARWAAFFDLANIPWQYEPIDLQGYIPDFVVPWHNDLLVEVKAECKLSDLDEHKAKIENSGWPGEALIVGTGLICPADQHPILGLIGEREVIDGELTWRWDTVRAFECISCGGASVLAESGSWLCRACWQGVGNEHVGACRDRLVTAFTEAGNRVQWKGPVAAE